MTLHPRRARGAIRDAGGTASMDDRDATCLGTVNRAIHTACGSDCRSFAAIKPRARAAAQSILRGRRTSIKPSRCPQCSLIDVLARLIYSSVQSSFPWTNLPFALPALITTYSTNDPASSPKLANGSAWIGQEHVPSRTVFQRATAGGSCATLLNPRGAVTYPPNAPSQSSKLDHVTICAHQ